MLLSLASQLAWWELVLLLLSQTICNAASQSNSGLWSVLEGASGARKGTFVLEMSLSANPQAVMVESYNGTLERWESMENFSGLAPWINHHQYYCMRCRN